GEGDNRVLNLPIQSYQGNISVNAAVGHPYGVIRGTDFVYYNDDKNKKVVNEDGYYMTSDDADIIIGDPNPDWMGGINNTFSYKVVRLGFFLDMRQGVDVFSLDQWYGESTGLYLETAGLNDQWNPFRSPVVEGVGVLLPGVKEDGSPNDIYAENLNRDGHAPFGYAANNYGE